MKILKISEMDPMIKRNVLRRIIGEAIQVFGLITLILCSGLYLSNSPITALIFVECAHIVYRFFDKICFSIEKISYRIKEFIAHVSAGAIAVIVIAIIGFYVEDATVKSIVDFITKIITVIFVYPLTIPFFRAERISDKSLTRLRILSHGQKAIYKLLTILYRILIMAGFLLVAFVKAYTEFYLESAIITGCILWSIRAILYFYFFWNCGCIDESEETEEIDNQSIPNKNGEREISGREVERIVQKIADRWSYREDTSNMLSGGGRIRYSVSVQMIGFNTISYTINGKLSGVRDEQTNQARTYFATKMDKASFNIVEETKRELAKHNLPSSYDINVNQGSIV